MNKYQEALDYINKSICTLLALRGIQDEQVIKNLHILQEVVDKKIPEKPYYLNYGVYKIVNYYCPNCEEIIDDGDMYCKHCGQKLYWSNEVENN